MGNINVVTTNKAKVTTNKKPSGANYPGGLFIFSIYSLIKKEVKE